MDPTQALADALRAMHALDAAEEDAAERANAIEALGALAYWLRNHGAAPDVLDAMCKSDAMPSGALGELETWLDAHPRPPVR